MTAPAQDNPEMLAGFLRVNGDFARSTRIRLRLAARRPKKLWDGPFVQLGNSKVEASFADHRTYIYKGKSRSADPPGLISR
jgi:hypothetical protein